MAKRVALLGLLLVFLASSLAAQTETAPLVTVKSKPSGSSVVLSGDLNVVGVTPTTFKQRMQGYYTITAYHEGYETYHSGVLLTGRDVTTIEINLVPKTRAKAALRSLVLPGWGQRYSGSKTRGVMLTIAAITAGVTAGILHLDYDSRRDDYDELKLEYDRTREVSVRESMLDDLYEAQKEADDAEKARNIGFGLLAGIWAYNVIDAVLFFPDFGITIAGSDLTFHPEIDADGVRLVGVVSF